MFIKPKIRKVKIESSFLRKVIMKKNKLRRGLEGEQEDDDEEEGQEAD
jgi:hypothetical protein